MAVEAWLGDERESILVHCVAPANGSPVSAVLSAHLGCTDGAMHSPTCVPGAW